MKSGFHEHMRKWSSFHHRAQSDLIGGIFSPTSHSLLQVEKLANDTGLRYGGRIWLVIGPMKRCLFTEIVIEQLVPIFVFAASSLKEPFGVTFTI